MLRSEHEKIRCGSAARLEPNLNGELRQGAHAPALGRGNRVVGDLRIVRTRAGFLPMLAPLQRDSALRRPKSPILDFKTVLHR